uniref:Uncharacterized protein n=1 Tax=Leptobrachium leishanense TaxID=445787 RepID=A0A8C5WHS5_9ANUR
MRSCLGRRAWPREKRPERRGVLAVQAACPSPHVPVLVHRLALWRGGPQNGRAACASFLPSRQRLLESTVLLAVSTLEIALSLWRIDRTSTDCPLFYLLDPCHVVTMLQIFLLPCPPSRLSTVVFRLHLHMSLLNGALLAQLFHVLNTRLLRGKESWIVPFHILLYTNPLPASGVEFCHGADVTLHASNPKRLLCSFISCDFRYFTSFGFSLI